MGTIFLQMVPIIWVNRSLPGCQATVIVAGVFPSFRMDFLPGTLWLSFLWHKPLSSPFGLPDYLPGRSALQCFLKNPGGFYCQQKHFAE
jgi:hypothetical protein